MWRDLVWRLVDYLMSKPSILRRIPGVFLLFLPNVLSPIISVEVFGLVSWDFAFVEEFPDNKNNPQGERCGGI